MRKAKWVCALGAVAICGVFTTNSHAALLGLTQQNPDVFSDFTTISYTVSDGQLSATGTTETLNGVALNGTGTFTLHAFINHTGSTAANTTATAVSGTLTVTGNIGAGLQTLFASNTLTGFGFDTTAGNFDFLYSGNTGVLSAGKPVGVKLHANNQLNGNYLVSFFSADFQSTGTFPAGTSDTFAAPEPASLSILGLSSAALLLRRRRKA